MCPGILGLGFSTDSISCLFYPFFFPLPTLIFDGHNIFYILNPINVLLNFTTHSALRDKLCMADTVLRSRNIFIGIRLRGRRFMPLYTVKNPYWKFRNIFMKARILSSIFLNFSILSYWFLNIHLYAGFWFQTATYFFFTVYSSAIVGGQFFNAKKLIKYKDNFSVCFQKVN
jgi:hypothetical protein